MHDFFDCICMMMIVILTMLLVMIIQYNNNGSVIRTLILSHQTCYCKYNVQQMWTELKSSQRNMSHSSACLTTYQNIKYKKILNPHNSKSMHQCIKSLHSYKPNALQSRNSSSIISDTELLIKPVGLFQMHYYSIKNTNFDLMKSNQCNVNRKL